MRAGARAREAHDWPVGRDHCDVIGCEPLYELQAELPPPPPPEEHQRAAEWDLVRWRCRAHTFVCFASFSDCKTEDKRVEPEVDELHLELSAKD